MVKVFPNLNFSVVEMHDFVSVIVDEDGLEEVADDAQSKMLVFNFYVWMMVAAFGFAAFMNIALVLFPLRFCMSC